MLGSASPPPGCGGMRCRPTERLVRWCDGISIRGMTPGGCWRPDCVRCSRIFRDGLVCSELRITPLGGALFGAETTPLLDSLDWGERAVAILLDRLIWIASSRGERARVHYGSLDVEDLGSIYEGLLEQEPGIATEPLARARRGKQEVVVAAPGSAADIQPGQFFLRAGHWTQGQRIVLYAA